MPTLYEKEKRAFIHSRCGEAVKNLKSREFDAMWFESRDEAVATIMNIIPKNVEVGAGGSVTLEEIGIFDALSGRGNRLFVHDINMDFQQSIEIRKHANNCPYYLTSSNAITMHGELVNIDGVGNRAAAMSFGPEVLITVAGANKLVNDLDEGISRVRNIAAPINARRVGKDTPCVKAGRCVDCHSPSSICRITTIISQKPMLTDFKVILIAEDLGF